MFKSFGTRSVILISQGKHKLWSKYSPHHLNCVGSLQPGNRESHRMFTVNRANSSFKEGGHKYLEIAYFARRYMSLVMRKPAFCICENKDADQLRGNPRS